MKKAEEDYGIDLKRFKNHQKNFPWMFILKVIIGLSLVFAAWYFSKELVNQENKRKEGPLPNEVEVEISVD